MGLITRSIISFKSGNYSLTLAYRKFKNLASMNWWMSDDTLWDPFQDLSPQNRERRRADKIGGSRSRWGAGSQFVTELLHGAAESIDARQLDLVWLGDRLDRTCWDRVRTIDGHNIYEMRVLLACWRVGSRGKPWTFKKQTYCYLLTYLHTY